MTFEGDKSLIEEKMAFEGDKCVIGERSSHTSCRFNLGMGSATEEGTLRLNESILQDLEGPISGFACPNMVDLPQPVQNKEEERCLNKDGHTDGNRLNYKTPELQMPVNTDMNLTCEMSLGFKQGSSSNNTEIIPGGELISPAAADHNGLEDIHPMQMEDQVDDQVGQWSFQSNPAESTDGIQAADDNTADASVQRNAEGPKSKSGRRKIKEKLQPTRFSSRKCKKVLETSTLEEDDDEDDEEPSKKHFCLYCKNPFCRLLRHLEHRHSDETEVAHAIHFPKGSKIRHSLLDQIRNKGDYEHNCRVLKSGEGEIVTKKSMNNPTLSVRDYLPCQHCLAFYRKTDLWKHERACKRKGDQKPDIGAKRCRVQSAASRLLPMSEFLTGGCEEIIHIMHQDDISHHVRNDPLICKYGNALLAKHDHDRSQFAYIGQKMRELGRFVLTAKEIDSSVQYLHEMCTPHRFELAVEGAKKLAGFDPSSSRYKTVSLVSKIGYSLKRSAEIAFGESRMSEDSETEAQIQSFINLLDKKWNKSFFTSSRMAAHRLEHQKVEIDKSTLTEDLIKLYRFVTTVGEEATQELKENPGSSPWRKLGEVTLTEVYLFNRVRVGNTGRMLLKEYNSKKTEVPFVPSADQILKCTKLELELKDALTRLELEGHGCRNMLVLLTEKMVSSIDLLNETRDKASVAEGNPYVFARNECLSPLRALDYLRKAATECGVQSPDAILSATLRDQVASYWQLMSLKEQELKKIDKLLDRSRQECSNLTENPSLLEEMSKQLLKMDRTLYFSPVETSVSTEASGTIPKKFARKKGWSNEEQEAVRRYLGHCFTLMKLPGKKQCMACITAEPALKARSWTDVKSYVHNRLQTMKRKCFHHKARGDVRFLKKKNQRRGRQAIRKELPDKNKKNKKDFVLSRTTYPPSEHREISTAIPTAVLYPKLTAKPSMSSGDSSMGSFKSNLAVQNAPMIPTFTPLNAQIFTPEGTRSTQSSPPYSPQHTKSMPVLPAYPPQHSTSMPGHPAGYSPHGSSPPMIPTFMPLNAPSSQMVPRFTPLNDRRSNMLSSFRPLNHSSTPVYPASPPRTHSITPLPSTHSTNPIPSSHSTTPLTSSHSTNPNLRTNPTTHTTNTQPRTHTNNLHPRTHTTNPHPRTHGTNPHPGTNTTNPHPRTHSNNPTPTSHTTNPITSTHAPSQSVQHRTASMKKKNMAVATTDTQSAHSPPQKTPKRTKRLWSEAEQAAVRRQLGDLCMLAKAPGKKDCDACLAAEPALSSRTWREVKYFVHNTIQAKKKRGSASSSKHTVPLSHGVHNSSVEWDAPVYLSL